MGADAETRLNIRGKEHNGHAEQNNFPIFRYLLHADTIRHRKSLSAS